MARAVGLTLSHLAPVIRRRTGQSAQEWIVEGRMAEACRLLVGTDLSVEEISRRAGYGDPSYFLRFFKRAHGATPAGVAPPRLP